MYILAFDSCYSGNEAKTVCLYFKDWTDVKPAKVISELFKVKEPYQAGSFYKRELPCIINLLKKIDLKEIQIIIVDGFVVLDDNNRLGLGGHLFEFLQRKIPVIGVAKNNFLSLNNNKRLLFRGKSNQPLYITALGIDADIACENIKKMNGDFRIPALLKRLDSITKEK